MRVVLGKPIRRDWINHRATKGLLLEKDIGVGHGKLKAKLLVFKNRLYLRKFWINALGKDSLGFDCSGAVNGLFCEVRNYTMTEESACLMVDPRYFAVIGLVKGNLGMEVITHESVHAAYNFAKRKSRCPWKKAQSFDEETICYPAGRISAAINRALYAADLY